MRLINILGIYMCLVGAFAPNPLTFFIGAWFTLMDISIEVK